MKKNIFQKLIVLLLSLLFLVGVCLLEGMTWEQLVDNMTFLSLAIWAFILLDDFFAKVIWYRYAITGRYLAYEGLYAISLVCMTGAFLADSFGWALGTLIGSIVFFAGGLTLHVICYKDKEYTSFEIERAKWLIFVDSIDKMESSEELKAKLQKFLRFHVKRDVLKGMLDISRPLDTTGDNRTVDEMLLANPNDENALNAMEYIDGIVDRYWELKNGGTK